MQENISQVLTKIKEGLDPIQARILLNDIYVNSTGIFNIKEKSKRPLNAIAMFDAEEHGINSYLVDSLRLFRDNKVYKYFGLSWADMKKLTHEEFVFIMELAAEANSEEQKKISSTLNSFNEAK